VIPIDDQEVRGADRGLINQYGVIPAEILQGQNLYSLLTSMFLHGGWLYLIGNMLYLWVFGDNIEAVIGHIGYLAFYLLGGLAASAAHIALNADSSVPSISASGAITAVRDGPGGQRGLFRSHWGLCSRFGWRVCFPALICPPRLNTPKY